MKKILLILVLIILTSCVKSTMKFPIYYTIENHSGQNIIVYSVPVSTNYIPDQNTVDSIYHIADGENRTVLVDLEPLGQESNPETGGSLENIRRLEIYTIDSIKGNRNYLNTRYWMYSLPNQNEGKLELIVLPEDFSR